IGSTFVARSKDPPDGLRTNNCDTVIMLSGSLNLTKLHIGAIMSTGGRELKRIHKGNDHSHFLWLAGLACAPFATHCTVPGDTPAWPQSRGPEANPGGAHARLAERWSKTENVEWMREIPGRGWSSPVVTGDKVFVTTATTEGKSKPPQIGTEYSNEYVAELQKQGLSMQQIIERVTERDIELPKEVKLHYLLYCLNLKSG